jgi:predicted metal-binding membrane protein
MQGMDAGPWTRLGGLGGFVGVWVLMMAAMMIPSALPTVAVHARLARGRSSLSPLLFTLGYLGVWAASGLGAYAAAALAGRAVGDVMAWDRAGRWAAGATLFVAAGYQLTPLKDACLGRCRAPLAFLLGSWRPGLLGAFRMGVESGVWCAGCCWALMASLFALGIMSVTWMAVVATLVAAEKLLPWRRVGPWSAASLLAALGVLVLLAPHLVPGLTIPAAPVTGMGM